MSVVGLSSFQQLWLLGALYSEGGFPAGRLESTSHHEGRSFKKGRESESCHGQTPSWPEDSKEGLLEERGAILNPCPCWLFPPEFPWLPRTSKLPGGPAITSKHHTLRNASIAFYFEIKYNLRGKIFINVILIVKDVQGEKRKPTVLHV